MRSEPVAQTLRSVAASDLRVSTLADAGHKPRQKSDDTTPEFRQRIGYARVSTGDQDVARQVTELTSAGCSRVFTDEGVSGVKMARPGLSEALDFLRQGDTLVVNELSRLGRDTAGVLQLVQTSRSGMWACGSSDSASTRRLRPAASC